MNKITFNDMADIARTHLDHIIHTSKDSDDLFFRLAGFYGGVNTIVTNRKFINDHIIISTIKH